MNFDSLKSPQALQRIIKCVLCVALFLLIFVVLYSSAQTDEALTSSAQKLVCGIGCGGLLGALAVWFIGVQLDILPRKSREHGPFFWPVLSGLLALCVMCLAYAYLGVWPIGVKSVMMVDMHHQYAPLMNELRDMLLNGGDFLYDFNLGLGGSFLPMFGYYLASPFNLLLCLFPEHLLTEGILVITLLKNALTAAFFAACVQYIFRRRSPAVAITAVMYSMMMYLIAYSWNIMWLDGVMMLPLVVLCFERLMRTGRYLPYVLSLAYALFCNYYIGFMLCIFLVLYYIGYVARKQREIGQLGLSVVRFGIGSLLGGGLGMGLLLPVAMALGSTSAAGGKLPELASNFDMFTLFYQFLYGTEPTIRSGNMPNLYCGLLAVFLLPIFATTKTIPVRRRLTMGALAVLLGLSCVFNQWDLVWHGLHAPNDLPYRFSFLVCFVLLLIAYETIIHLHEIRLSQIGLSLGGCAAFLILTETLKEDATFTAIYVSLGLCVLYAAICALIARKKLVMRAGYVLLLTVVVAEMLFHGQGAFIKLNKNEYFTNHEHYVDSADHRAAQLAINTLKDESDELFTRMGLLPTRTCVDTSLFHYSGMTVFASSNSYATTRFMGSIGYAINGVNSYLYHSFVPAADALFSMGYFASKDEVNSPYAESLGTVTEGDITYYLYKSKAVLPLAYPVQNGADSWKWQYYNPIRSLNTLYQRMAGIEGNLFDAQPLSIYPGDDEHATVSGTSSFSIRPKDPYNSASYYAIVEEGGPCYVYVDCRAAESIYVEIYEDYSVIDSYYASTNEPYIYYAGDLEPGTEVKVTVESKITASGNIYVCTFDNELFDECLDKLSNGGLQLTSFSDSHIKGTMSSDTDTAVMTGIPYDAGWTVKVDGVAVETYGLGKDALEEVTNAMLMFDMPAGEHEVEFIFVPKGFIPGVVISLVSLALLVLLVLYMRRRVTDETDPPIYPEGIREVFDEAAFAREFAAEIAEEQAAAEAAAEVTAEAVDEQGDGEDADRPEGGESL